ncbi:MAG: hypothetical protein GX495_02935 [Chloroflexi bacterium]|jgi:mannosyltransferase|nr:hypothetical protein [Chloroflexota bacterium]
MMDASLNDTNSRPLVTSGRLEYILLAAVTLLAAGLRLFRLGEWSFWGDELIMVERALNFPALGLGHKSFTAASMHLVIGITGVSEWGARLAPAMIGTFSIPLLYFVVRRFLAADITLAAVLLLAVSPWHIYWSQNARFYPTVLLFYCLSLFVFYLGIEKDRLWLLLLSLVFLGLAFLERYFALFLVPVMAGYLLLVKILPLEKPRGLRLKNVGALTLPALAGIPLVMPTFLSMTGDFVESYAEAANNSPLWVVGGAVYYIGVPVIVAAILGLVHLYRQKNRLFLLVGLGALVPMLGTAFLSFFTYTANRYIFVSLFCWILAASVGAVELLRQTRGTARLLASGMLLVMVLLPMSENALYYQYQHGNRANWKAATSLVENRLEEGDQIVASSRIVAEYYLGREVTSFNRVDLDAVPNSDGRVWFLEDMVGEAYWPRVHRWLVRNASLEGVFDVQVAARNFKMRVYLYDPAQAAAIP